MNITTIASTVALAALALFLAGAFVVTVVTARWIHHLTRVDKINAAREARIQHEMDHPEDDVIPLGIDTGSFQDPYHDGEGYEDAS